MSLQILCRHCLFHWIHTGVTFTMLMFSYLNSLLKLSMSYFLFVCFLPLWVHSKNLAVYTPLYIDWKQYNQGALCWTDQRTDLYESAARVLQTSRTSSWICCFRYFSVLYSEILHRRSRPTHCRSSALPSSLLILKRQPRPVVLVLLHEKWA